MEPLEPELELELELIVGRPVARDARCVMEWRNDPETLRNSFHPEPKRWPAFADEFRAEYCDDPRFPPLFGAVAGRRVGFVRLRRCPDPRGRNRCAVDIGVNVAPAERRRGWGVALIDAAVGFARGQGAEVVIAEIKVENAGSIAAFERAGFARVDRVAKALAAPDAPDPHAAAARPEVYRYERVTVPVLEIARPTGGVRRLGPGEPCFVIAEAGSNWRMGTAARDRRMAHALIDVAADAGCDAVKFQTYRADTVYVANAGTSDYLADAGIQEPIRDIFVDLAMPYEMIPDLAAYAQARGILFMSTPFSPADFDALDPFVPLHKLASYEISHRRLIEKMAASGKPVVMSTGASRLEEIRWAIDHFRAAGGGAVALMQCTARYPAPLETLNLETIPAMRGRFGVPVGLSDHSREAAAGPAAAVALGAAVIEKHYTLDRRLPGPDHAFAVDPEELAQMVRAVREAERSRGDGLKEVHAAEGELRLFARRGLQATRAIRTGEVLREGVNYDILRPGQRRQGMHPRMIDAVEGQAARRDIALGDGIVPADLGRDG